MSELQLGFASLHYIYPIVFVVYEKDADLGFNEIRRVIKSCETLSRGQPYVVLSDARGGVNVTPLGLKVAQDPNEAPLHCGSAVLVRNNFVQAAASIFNGFNRLPCPYKVFTDQQKAIDWLRATFHSRLTNRMNSPGT